MIEHQIGEGDLAEAGREVVVHYTGWLFDAAAPENKGSKFDSSPACADSWRNLLEILLKNQFSQIFVRV